MLAYFLMHVHEQDGLSPLSAAIGNGHTEVMDTLLKYGADPNLTPPVQTQSTVHSIEVILLLGGVVCNIYACVCSSFVRWPYICMYVSPMHLYSKFACVLKVRPYIKHLRQEVVITTCMLMHIWMVYRVKIV